VGDHILLFDLPKITLVNFLFACSN
jgi:hypothetical protein